MTIIRTRIAPSPTGDPHVGTAYIALFNLCFARQQQGKFILRIEDTDRVRSTEKSEQDILQALKWLDLRWDEGPDIGGDYGPYRQSERTAIYQQHGDILLEQKHAFYCFCSSQRLDQLRQQQLADKKPLGYDGCCLALSEQEINAKLDAKETYVVRMKVPQTGACTVQDLLRDNIEIEWQQIDMQVLLKSDGHPTYHLANVVDDHLMQISHVIRGEEWINSSPKHLLLYQYFGWQPPVFCHMPLLRNADKSKLSKRKNPTSIGYYRDMGYLPEALVNYLGMMGWTMPDGEEKFSLSQMIKHFDIKRVSLGGPVFDGEKLDWLNGRYIREDLSVDDFIDRMTRWAFNADKMQQIVPLLQDRVQRLCDVLPLAGFFLAGNPVIEEESFQHKNISLLDVKKNLQFSLWCLEGLSVWNRDEIEHALQVLAAQMECKIRDFLQALFVAITGKTVSTSVVDAMAILGLDITRARIRHGIQVLGGVSKNENKRWEKEYRNLAALLKP